jgi:hypothetical protein
VEKLVEGLETLCGKGGENYKFKAFKSILNKEKSFSTCSQRKKSVSLFLRLESR